MKNIICLGDSITAGRTCPEGRRWTTVLQNLLNAQAPGIFDVYNRGVGGNTSAQGLDRFDAEVKPLLPGWVLLEFGFNDASVPPDRRIPRCSLAAFQENLRELIRLTRTLGGKPILLTNHRIVEKRPDFPQGNGKDYPKNFLPYQAAIRTISEATKTPLIDLEKMMLKKKITAADVVNADGLHLSWEGNTIYAQLVFAGLYPLLKKASKTIP